MAAAGAIRIERADRGQVGAILRLWKELADYHRSIGGPPRRTDPPRRLAEFLESQIESPDCLVLVALSGTEVVGFALAFVAEYHAVFRLEAHGFIGQIYVREGERRRGVGTALVRRIGEWFSDRGISRIELHVSPANGAGRRFWERLGFTDYETVMVRDTERSR